MFDMMVNMVPWLLVQVKSKLKGHSKRITGLAFSNVLNVLVSSGADAQVRTIFFLLFWESMRQDQQSGVFLLLQLCVWNTDGWEKQRSKVLPLPQGRPNTAPSDTRVQFHQDQAHFLVVHETQLAIYETTKLECMKQVSLSHTHCKICNVIMHLIDDCIDFFTVASERIVSSNHSCHVLMW